MMIQTFDEWKMTRMPGRGQKYNALFNFRIGSLGTRIFKRRGLVSSKRGWAEWPREKKSRSPVSKYFRSWLNFDFRSHPGWGRVNVRIRLVQRIFLTDFTFGLNYWFLLPSGQRKLLFDKQASFDLFSPSSARLFLPSIRTYLIYTDTFWWVHNLRIRCQILAVCQFWLFVSDGWIDSVVFGHFQPFLVVLNLISLRSVVFYIDCYFCYWLFLVSLSQFFSF